MRIGERNYRQKKKKNYLSMLNLESSPQKKGSLFSWMMMMRQNLMAT